MTEPADRPEPPVPTWAKVLVGILCVVLAWVIVGLLVWAGVEVWGQVFQ